MTRITLSRQSLMIISLTATSIIALGIFTTPSESVSIQELNPIIQTAEAGPGAFHDIEISAVELPDGLFAYRMDEHLIDGDDVTSRYSSKASIPGPTIVIDEGDSVELTITNRVPCDNYPDTIDAGRETPSIGHIGVHVHGVHYDINSDGSPKIMNMMADQGGACGSGTYTYDWVAAPGTAGTWPYHDHTFLSHMGGEEVGLFGTLIVQTPTFEALIDGITTNVNVETQIKKDFILWMVSSETLGRSIFYGMEIDNEVNGGQQTPLWHNPNLVATEGDIVRFHILGLGDETHSFHQHAHRWLEPGTSHIIDVEEIVPLDMHVFAVKAGEGVGTGDWMYHCHVFEHMLQGMAGMFKVIDGDDTLPSIGAVFTISDEPGLWFKTVDAGLVDVLDPREGIGFPIDFLGPGPFSDDTEGRSLAIMQPGNSVLFTMKDSQTKHTITSLIWPDTAVPTDVGDAPIHFDQELPVRGSTMIQDNMGIPQTLDTPGLYVWTCKIHPYMFAAVLVDDDGGLPLDIADPASGKLSIATRVGASFPVTVPATDPLSTALLTTFYVVTDPSNWKDYSTGSWEVNHPPVPVTPDGGTTTINLSALDIGPLGISVDPPNKKGVGEVWVNTQFERTVQKNDPGTANDKPGTVTVVDARTWDIERKIALPEINMNHPHNMWTNTLNDVVYQTQWFDHRMVVIDRETGELVKDVRVGESPSHVMTTPQDDQIFIAMNGEEQVTEIDPVTYEISRQISTGVGGPAGTVLDTGSHPHGHWISPITDSGNQYIVTPNFFTFDSSIIDISNDPPIITRVPTGAAPIATGMMPDGSVYYTADFLGNSFTKIRTSDGAVLDTIDLLSEAPALTGLPIQTPISPDGRWMVTANVLFASITILDTSTDTIVAQLPCDPGCHGVQWGAKKGGDYYAYVSSKFSNALIVVDPDPNGNGDGSDAEVAGTVLLTKEFYTEIDDRIIDHPGMGGQGVLTIPNVYNGWIQETVDTCGKKVDPCSKEIVDFLKELKKDQEDPSNGNNNNDDSD